MLINSVHLNISYEFYFIRNPNIVTQWTVRTMKRQFVLQLTKDDICHMLKGPYYW